MTRCEPEDLVKIRLYLVAVFMQRQGVNVHSILLRGKGEMETHWLSVR